MEPGSEIHRYFNEINETFSTQREFLINGNPTEPSLIERFERGDGITFSTGWENHVVGLSLNKDIKDGERYLIYSNRGSRKKFEHNGTLVIKIPGHKTIRSDDLENFIPKRDSLSEKEMLDKINGMTDPNPPFMILPTKDQEIKNCSVANCKTLVIGIIALKKFIDEKNKMRPEDRTPEALDKAKNQAMKYAKVEYKKYSKDLRDVKVNKLISGYQSSVANGKFGMKEFYYNLLLKYLIAHHGQKFYRVIGSEVLPRDEKISAELDRAFLILNSLTPSDRARLIETNKVIINSMALTALKKSKFDLLKLCGFPKPLISLIDSIRAGNKESFNSLVREKEVQDCMKGSLEYTSLITRLAYQLDNKDMFTVLNDQFSLINKDYVSLRFLVSAAKENKTEWFSTFIAKEEVFNLLIANPNFLNDLIKNMTLPMISILLEHGITPEKLFTLGYSNEANLLNLRIEEWNKKKSEAEKLAEDADKSLTSPPKAPLLTPGFEMARAASKGTPQRSDTSSTHSPPVP